MTEERITLKVDDDMERLVLEVLGVWGERMCVYQSAGILVEPQFDPGKELMNINRALNGVRMSVVRSDRARALAAKHCQFMKKDMKGKWVNCIPPDWLAPSIVSRVDFPCIPVLESVSDGPALRRDGSVQTEPGYDRTTGNLYVSDGTSFPPLIENPTKDDAHAAAQELAEPFAQFPWKGLSNGKDDEHDAAVAIACIITMVVRPSIPGAVPCFAFKTPTPGSGKGLLVDMMTTIATGYPASVETLSEDEHELRKALLATATEGARVTSFDNINGPVGSPVLSSTVTSGKIKGRALGLNKNIDAPWRSVVILNGNGMSFRHDFWRRVLLSEIDPQCEDPTTRKVKYNLEEPREHVKKERPRLFMAALTIVRAYKLAVKRGETNGHGKPRKISFEAWDDAVRAPLIWCGIADPCTGEKDIRKEADTDIEQLAQLLSAWREAFKDKAMTLVDAVEATHATMTLVKDGNVNLAPSIKRQLAAAFTGLDEKTGDRYNSSTLGWPFRRYHNRVVNGLCLVRAGEKSHVALWKVVDIVNDGLAVEISEKKE